MHDIRIGGQCSSEGCLLPVAHGGPCTGEEQRPARFGTAEHLHVANDPKECAVCLTTEVADLQRRLRRAERQALLNLGQAWQREDITRAERDAAIERGRIACHFVRIKDADVWWFVDCLRKETKRAEAEEQLIAELGSVMTEHCDVVDLEDMPGSLQRGFEAVERDAAEQRALAERLGKALFHLHAPGGKAHDTPTGRWLKGETRAAKHDCQICVLLAEAQREGDDG